MAEGPMSVGGQAILEGVMMRSPHSLAIAVRRASGEIVVKEAAWHSIWEKARWLRKPFLRGAVVLFESLHNGISALTFSANEAARELPVEGAEGKPADAKPPTDSGASNLAIAGTIALSVAFGFGMFAALPHFITWLAGVMLGSESLASGKDFGFQIVDGIVKIVFLVGYMALISRMKDIKRVFQYHGAEHKSIYCYEAGLPLTVANARTFSRQHPRCGTSFLLITVVVSILLFSVVFPFLPRISSTGWLNQLAYVFIKIPLMFPVAGIAYEATRLSARHPRNLFVRGFTWPGLMLQNITTQEPDDTQLEIALVALQKTLWREAQLQQNAAAGLPVGDAEPLVFPTYDAFVSSIATLPPPPVDTLAA
jgi:uncharacterized protein YqhQ